MALFLIKEATVLIGLAHTAKIGATFHTENGIVGPLDGPEGDRASEFSEKTAHKLGIRFGGCANPISTEATIVLATSSASPSLIADDIGKLNTSSANISATGKLYPEKSW